MHKCVAASALQVVLLWTALCAVHECPASVPPLQGRPEDLAGGLCWM